MDVSGNTHFLSQDYGIAPRIFLFGSSASGTGDPFII